MTVTPQPRKSLFFCSIIIILLLTWLGREVSADCLCFKESAKVYCDQDSDTGSVQRGLDTSCRLLARTIIWLPPCIPNFSRLFPSADRNHACFVTEEERSSVGAVVESASSSSTSSTTTTRTISSTTTLEITSGSREEREELLSSSTTVASGRESISRRPSIIPEAETPKTAPSSSASPSIPPVRPTTPLPRLDSVLPMSRASPAPSPSSSSSSSAPSTTTTTTWRREDGGGRGVGVSPEGVHIQTATARAEGGWRREVQNDGVRMAGFHQPESIPVIPVETTPGPTGVLVFTLTTHFKEINASVSHTSEFWWSGQNLQWIILGSVLTLVSVLAGMIVGGVFLFKRVRRRRALKKMRRLKEGENLDLEYDSFAEEMTFQLPGGCRNPVQYYQLQPLPSARSPSPSPPVLPASSGRGGGGAAGGSETGSEASYGVYNSTITTTSTGVF